MKEYHQHMWEHMKKFYLRNIEQGIQCLKNGTLDLLLGDTAILDYYRATDHKCSLQKVGEPYIEDAYAIGMKKGFPLKDSISALIAKYSSNGYLDILTEKWYGGLPCYKLDNDIVMPRPLGVEAVAGVFLLLGLGVILGVLILIFEHLFFKYSLPILRLKPKGSVWRSRNIMFFSQKLYRFINCVELVSPHHAARELVHTLRQGQIASLFQKSIKRKEDEQRRRRRSKAQFFEMIQEIRRVQQAEKMKPKLEVVSEDIETTETSFIPEIPEIIESSFPLKILPNPRLALSPKPRLSPMHKLFRNNNNSRSKSNSSTVCARRFSTDSILSERLDTIGRRLSRDLTNSPPDFGRRYEILLDKGEASNINTTSEGGQINLKKYESINKKHFSTEKLEEAKLKILNKKNYVSDKTLSATIPRKKYQTRRIPLNADIFASTTLSFGKTIPINKDEDLIKNSVTASKASINKIKSELPVDLLQASISTNNHIVQRSKDNLIAHSSDKKQCSSIYDSYATSNNKIQHFLQQQTLFEKRSIHRSSSSQTTSIPNCSKHLKKRSIQNFHYRQRSLDGLDIRTPMPLPTEVTIVPRSHSTDKIDYIKKNDNNIQKNHILLDTDHPVKKNIKYSEFKKISFDHFNRTDSFKLRESTETEIHKYLSKSKQTDYTDKPS